MGGSSGWRELLCPCEGAGTQGELRKSDGIYRVLDKPWLCFHHGEWPWAGSPQSHCLATPRCRRRLWPTCQCFSETWGHIQLRISVPQWAPHGWQGGRSQKWKVHSCVLAFPQQTNHLKLFYLQTPLSPVWGWPWASLPSQMLESPLQHPWQTASAATFNDGWVTTYQSPSISGRLQLVRSWVSAGAKLCLPVATRSWS